MARKWNLFLALCFCLCTSFFSVAQNNDSVQNNEYNELKSLILQYERQRLLDSIRIANLVHEVKQNNTTSKNSNNSGDSEIDSARLASQLGEIDQLRQQTLGYPVTLFNDTIFEIFTPMGSFSPEQRAKEAHNKIVKLYNKHDFNPDSLKLKMQFGHQNIVYGSEIILTINNYDALWMDMDLDALANQYLANIRYVIDENKKQHTWEQIAMRWAQILLIIVIAYFVWYIIKKLSNQIINYLTSTKNNIVKDIKIKKYELIDRKLLLKSLIRIVTILKNIILLVIIYFAISFVLNVFPVTQKYTHTLWTFVFDPIRDILFGFVSYLPNLFRITAFILVCRYIVHAFRYFSLEIEKGDLKLRHFHPEWAKTTYQIIRILLIAFCIILIFPYLPGSDTDAFKGISVFAGVLISFGSSSAISNTIAGFVITYMRPFKVGDWIKVGDDIGKVVEKTLLVTRIQTINNEDITIPNSTILSKHTKNYSANSSHDGLVISADVTFAYSVEWRAIHEVLIAAAKKNSYINPNKEPFVLQKTLDEYYVTYQINMFTLQPEKMYFIHTELLQHIQDGFKEAGLDLHLPAQISIIP